MSTAPVSVVIPTYNHAHLVTQAVESVLAQTLAPAEIIVVDDGSKDDTAQRLAKYGNHVRYIYQPNQGVSAARNNGVAAATCEFVAFLDSDDVWHPRKTELQMQVLRSRPEIGALGCRVFHWPSPRFPDVPADGERRVSLVSWRQLAIRNYIGLSSAIVRRDVLRRVGPFDTGMQGPEDRDLWLRGAEVTTLANLDVELTGYRVVAGSVSKQAAVCHAGMNRIFEKVGERGGWKGRPLLRQKSYSYTHHAVAFIYGSNGHYGTAVWNLLKSMAAYPLPYDRAEVEVPFERPRRLLVNLLRMLRLKEADQSFCAPGLASHEVSTDALEALKLQQAI
jgi:glycosyltransferase involved in cell wall biosynthesis